MSGKEIVEGLSFDDVLVEPAFSEILPDKVNITSKISRCCSVEAPFVSSPMDTVTESEMAIGMALLGGIGIIHRKMTIEEQTEEVNLVLSCLEKSGRFEGDVCLRVGVAVGADGDFLERAKELQQAGAKVVVIDSSHGHSSNVVNALSALKKCLTIDVIAGNIATKNAAEILLNNGADGLRVGIGPGSICTTRVVTGCGVPQITAIMEVAEKIKDEIPIIADGGIKNSGDIVKAIAAGADAVMMGSLLAGTAESPGKEVNLQDKKYKYYRGMGSEGVIGEGGDRYGAKAVAEGVEGLVPYAGSLSGHFQCLKNGLRQGMGYAGCASIGQLKHQTRFIRITNAGLLESHPHGIVITKKTTGHFVLGEGGTS